MWGSKISKPEGCGEEREVGGTMAAFVPAPPQDSVKRSPSSLIRHGLQLSALIGYAERADVPAAAGGLKDSNTTLSPHRQSHTHAYEASHTNAPRHHRTVSNSTNTQSRTVSYTRSYKLACTRSGALLQND